MKSELEALRDGTMSFDSFFLATEHEWHRLAKYLLRRWSVPDGVGLEDVVQELAVAAWQFVSKHDPTKASLHRFIIFNAVDKAKKWMHRQRAAYRRDDCSPSRHPLSDSSLEHNAPSQRWLEERAVVEYAELFDLRLEVVEFLAGLGPEERVVIELLAEEGFSIEAAVERLAGDVRYCIVHRLASKAAVQRRVRGIIKRVTEAA